LVAVKGTDTIYSQGKEIKTGQLKFYDYGGSLSFHRPFTTDHFITNLPDTNKGVHSKFFIDNIECRVTSEDGKVISISNDADIPSGYHSITIKRKGLQARYDSVYFYFGKWKKLNDFTVDPNPDINRPNYITDYAVFQKGTKGYLFGGFFFDHINLPTGPQSHPDYFMEYDQSIDSWTRIPYSVPTYFVEPLVQVVDDEAYIVNAYMDTTRTNSSYFQIKNVYKFDLANRRWIRKKAIPAPPRAHAVSFAGNGRIYLGLGGSTAMTGPAGSLVDLWEYNPATDSWLKKADFPGGGRVFAGSFVIGNKAYVFGGSYLVNGDNVSNNGSEIWEYDMSANSWRQILYRGRSLDPYISAVGISQNGKGYIVGGWTREIGAAFYYHAPAKCYRFDPMTETFEDLGYPPDANVHGGVLFRSGNRIILTGMELFGDYEHMSKNVTELTLE
jgi:N-acetylneuraminic acid mutarotase